MNETTQKISLDLIDDPHVAMRSDVHDEDIDQLMRDMKEVGLIEPIVVRKNGERFEVIAGHRRTTAARLLNWIDIEAKVVEANDEQAFQMRAIENLSRHDVNPVDEARFVGEIIRRQKKTLEEVAKIFNRSKEWIEQRLEIYAMPGYLQEYLGQRRISLGAALWINRIELESRRETYSNWAAINGISVSGAKRLHDLWAAEGLGAPTDAGTIEAAVQATGKFVAKVKCAACGRDEDVNAMQNIWIHPDQPCNTGDSPEENEGAVHPLLEDERPREQVPQSV